MNVRPFPLAMLLAVLCLPLAPVAHAAPAPSVRLSPAHAVATLHGSLRGWQIADYRVPARAGQILYVALRTRHGATYFNVLPPGSQEVAVHIGARDGHDWTAVVPADGVYTVRVYMMRSAARRNELARYTLSMTLGSDHGLPGKVPASDARVPGTPFHATSSLPCRLGTVMASCAAGVIRGAPGQAEVHLTRPDGQVRVLRFLGQSVLAGSGQPLHATRQDDGWEIEQEGGEHYSVPDALIHGG